MLKSLFSALRGVFYRHPGMVYANEPRSVFRGRLTPSARRIRTPGRWAPLALGTVLLAGSATAQVSDEPMRVPIMDQAAAEAVVVNIVRTAYMATHGGRADGFDLDAVSFTPVGGTFDLSVWVPCSTSLKARMRDQHRVEASDRVFHFWPGLLIDRQMSAKILASHYTGSL